MVRKIKYIHQEGSTVDVEALDEKPKEMVGPCMRTRANLKKKTANQDILELKKIALNMTTKN